ncbi:cytochrome P450 [Aspergillus falconensis]
MKTSAYLSALHLERNISTKECVAIYLFIFLTSLFAVWAWRVFAVPPELRHIPRVSIPKLLWSYAKAEPEDVRARRLIEPFVEDGEDVVLVWAFGRWIIHVIKDEVATSMLANIKAFPKERPPDGLLLWRLLGKSNVTLDNGALWKREAAIVRAGFEKHLPIEMFNSLSQAVVESISKSEEHGNCVDFGDLSRKYALDVVGTALLGMKLNCLREELEFVSAYNSIMTAIASPFYILFPWLETALPRRVLQKKIDWLRAQVAGRLAEREAIPAAKRDRDMTTTLIESNPPLSQELRVNNVISTFLAGHETSTGSISSLVYYLAKHPKIQEKCRIEAQQQIPRKNEPTQENLKRLPYLDACIKEALRVNNPAAYLITRVATQPAKLGKYHIPQGVSITVNIHAIHHNPAVYPEPYTFRPERHLEGSGGVSDRTAHFLPFARGPRQCPARVFAFYEHRALLVALLNNFRWSLPHDSRHLPEVQNAFSPFSTVIPEDLMLRFVHLEQGSPLPITDDLGGLGLVLSEMGKNTMRQFNDSPMSRHQDVQGGLVGTLPGWKWLADTHPQEGLHPQLMRDVLQCARIYNTVRQGKPKEVLKGLRMTVSNPSDPKDITSIGPKTLGGTAWKTNTTYSALLDEGEWNGDGFPPIGPCTLFIYLGLQKKIITREDAPDCAALQMLSTVDYDFDLNEANNTGFKRAIDVARKALKLKDDRNSAPLTGATLAAMLSFDLQKEVRRVQQAWCVGKYGATSLGPADIAPGDWVSGTVADCAGLCPFGYQGEAEYIKSKTGMFVAMLLANTHDLLYDIGSSNRMSSVMYAHAAGLAKDDLHCLFVRTAVDQIAHRVSLLTADETPLYGDSALLVTAAWAPFNGRYRTWERVVKYHRQLTQSTHAKAKLVLKRSQKDLVLNNLDFNSDSAENLWRRALDPSSLAHVQPRRTKLYAAQATLISWDSVLQAPGVPAPDLCEPCQRSFTAMIDSAPVTISSAIPLAPEITNSAALGAAARIALAGRWAMTPECCATCSAEMGHWADQAAYIVLVPLMQSEPVLSPAMWLLECYAVWCTIASPISVASILSGFDLLGEFEYVEGAMGNRDVVDC